LKTHVDRATTDVDVHGNTVSSGSVIWKRLTIRSRDVFPVFLGDNYRTARLRPANQPASLPSPGRPPAIGDVRGRRSPAIGQRRSVGGPSRALGPSSYRRHRQFAWLRRRAAASPAQDGRRRYAASDDSIFVHFILL